MTFYGIEKEINLSFLTYDVSNKKPEYTYKIEQVKIVKKIKLLH